MSSSVDMHAELGETKVNQQTWNSPMTVELATANDCFDEAPHPTNGLLSAYFLPKLELPIWLSKTFVQEATPGKYFASGYTALLHCSWLWSGVSVASLAEKGAVVVGRYVENTKWGMLACWCVLSGEQIDGAM